MLDKILVATGNKGKLKEIREILEDIEIIGMRDIGIEIEVEENGKTFQENAYIKASEIAKLTDMPVLADDSGLCVDVLDGAPGVFSARFAGENATDDENTEKLLSLLKDVPEEKRTARFVCSICLCFPDGRKIETFASGSEGIIIDEKRGENGFGYDPVFFALDMNKTYAEMTMEEKNLVSHRKAALALLSQKLKGENK